MLPADSAGALNYCERGTMAHLDSVFDVLMIAAAVCLVLWPISLVVAMFVSVRDVRRNPDPR
jgi:hypothetical protein